MSFLILIIIISSLSHRLNLNLTSVNIPTQTTINANACVRLTLGMLQMLVYTTTDDAYSIIIAYV